MVGLIPMFDPPRVDSGETIRRAKEMGVDVKMITGDQLAIAKETCRQVRHLYYAVQIPARCSFLIYVCVVTFGAVGHPEQHPHDRLLQPVDNGRWSVN